MTKSVKQPLFLRPEEKKDLEFLSDLYCVSRDYEMSNVNWPQEQKNFFLRQQFVMQKKYFDNVHKNAERNLVLKDSKPIGRLYFTLEQGKSLHLIDITLLREYRGQGIGQNLLEFLIEKAKKEGVSMTLNVYFMNPALRLYTRLGFRQVSAEQGHYMMQWN